MSLSPATEANLRRYFGRSQTAFERSTMGAALERAYLYSGPSEKPADKGKNGKPAPRDRGLDAARAQWLRLRKRADQYLRGQPAGSNPLLSFMTWVLLEQPWAGHETLPRLTAVYDELDRYYAAWSAGGVNEAVLKRWLANGVLPLRTAFALPEITARPTRETINSVVPEPAHGDLVATARVGRRLRDMARAGFALEVEALAAYYSGPGDHFEFAANAHPRVHCLMVLTQAGRDLLRRAPRSEATLHLHDHQRLRNALDARESAAFEPLRETFAQAELQAERLYQSACRAYRQAKSAPGAEVDAGA